MISQPFRLSSRVMISLMLAALLASALACQMNLGGPKPPATPVPLSPTEAQAFQESLQQAAEEAQQTGTTTLTLTDAQATDYVARKLTELSDLGLKEPIVLFRDGQVQVFATLETNGLSGRVQINLDATLDDQGRPVVTIASAQFGPIPLSQDLLATYAETIDSMINEQFNSLNGSLEALVINEGSLSLTVRLR